MNTFDSSVDTLMHIKRVSALMSQAGIELLQRGMVHDDSKLQAPEKELFDLLTPRLAGVTYGSEEYKSFLNQLKPALQHHYGNNSHHPEYYKNGIDGMNLFDILEMFFDWKAAGERHKDGDIKKSIEHNRIRFNMSDQLVAILNNTVEYMKDNPTWVGPRK